VSVLDYLNPEELDELDQHLRALEETGPQAHTAYQLRPEDWIVEQLGIPRHTLRWSLNDGYRGHTWDGTPDPLVAILDGLANWEDVGVEAATGTQKSFTAACIILWFLAAFKHSLVNTYAPKEDQLRLFIWKEIDSVWPRFQALFPTAEKTDLRIRMDGTDKWAAHGIATALRAGEESATKAQGAHAEHMLLVTEETPGIDPAIMTALRNTRTGDHNLQLSLGNPDNQQDTLHRFCILPDTRHVRISALDHPNVVTGRSIVPGAASPAGIRRIAAEDEPGTPMYESRVRGISPAEATDSLIKLSWITAAAERYATELVKGGRPAMGVDVANSEKGDKGSRAYGVGSCLTDVVTKPCPNANLLGSEVVNDANRMGIDPAHIGVDPIGVGAGTVNEMVRLGMEPRRLGGSLTPINGAQRSPDGASMDFAPDANLFLNLRSQMAWQLREDFRKGDIAINPELVKRLATQITAPRYEKSNGKVIVEEKAKIKKRLGHSPDDFDSIMYWNWVRPRSTPPESPEVAQDRHPGFDYKARTRKPRRSLVPDEDLRANHYQTPHGWRAPRFDEEEET
jgi:phage terminase large subunit